jgi:S1-C subfamily serine protease
VTNMKLVRILGLFAILFLATGGCVAQGVSSSAPLSLSDQIQRVRGSVVKIVVVRLDLRETPLAQSVQCPFTHVTCVVGSGFIVDEHGDVVTALHVVDGVTEVMEELANVHIEGKALISIEVPNHVAGGGVYLGNQVTSEYKVVASDKAHDIALLSNIDPLPKDVSPVSFDLDRRRDGEDVFACGYPLGALELTTTSGHVATSWAQHSLLTAKKYGILEESEVIRLDLRANPGSSGGPIFSSSNQSVIGLADEVSGLPGGWIAIAVPSVYITDLLTKNGVSWKSSAAINEH